MGAVRNCYLKKNRLKVLGSRILQRFFSISPCTDFCTGLTGGSTNVLGLQEVLRTQYFNFSRELTAVLSLNKKMHPSSAL
jgi:hypothetical protein